ncbi:hypothetical protein FWK35_00003500, partial [Aphis craccivora]
LILDFSAFLTASRFDPTFTPLTPLALSAFFSFLSLAAAAAAAPLINFLAAADLPLSGFLVLSAALVSFLSPVLDLAADLGLSFLATVFLAALGAAGSTAAFLAAGADFGASAAFFLVASFSVALLAVDFFGWCRFLVSGFLFSWSFFFWGSFLFRCWFLFRGRFLFGSWFFISCRFFVCRFL